jgi:DNA polymerase-3 subunit alpha
MNYQLNTVSSYTFGQSLIEPRTYSRKAKQLGYSGIAIADSSVYSFPSLAAEAKKNGLKPIFGFRISLYYSPMKNLSAVLYLKSEEGYHNLCKLLEKEDLVSPIGEDTLKGYTDGLAMVIDTHDESFYYEDFRTEAARLLNSYRSLFGDSLYLGLEIDTPEDKETAQDLLSYAKLQGIRMIAFPKVLYLSKKDAKSLSFFKAGYKKQVPDKEPEEEGPYFLLSPSALSALYPEETLQNASDFGDSLSFEFFVKRGKLISFPDDDETLKKLAEEGLAKKKGSELTKEYKDRLQYELSVIKEMHFSSYFLLVSDYVNFAKRSGIKVGPGRGSAGGSLVSYSLDIIELDPLAYRLSFERFLNPMRKTMPDIDVDFDSERRNEVVEYLKRKYGEERVSYITVFSTLKPKSSLKLMGPVFGVNDKRLSKLLMVISDKTSTFEDAGKDSFLGWKYQRLLEDPYYADLVEKVKPVIGLPVNTSIHPSGIIVSEERIADNAPMSNKTTGTALFEYPYMEELGFLKCDILSLSNLTFINQIEEHIKSRGLALPDISRNLEDPKVFDLINHQDLSSAFQIDHYGMIKAIEEVKPESFADLCAVIALDRPGPMDSIPLYARRRNGEEKTTYPDPLLEPVLKDTYGIIVYQEQVMETVKVLGGFTLGEADLFRRAISKKKASLMEEYKEKFFLGAKKNGVSEEKAESIYRDIEKFSRYGYNKAHTVSYGLICYTILYYKAEFPEDFYAVSYKETSPRTPAFARLAKENARKGFSLVNPDIASSLLEEVLFLDKRIVLPLSIISGTDKEFLSSVLEERKKKAFSSFYDFLSRVQPVLKKNGEKQIGKMIEAGAFDSLSKERGSMEEQLSSYLEFARMGIDSSLLPPLKEDSQSLGERLFLEKDSLGIILSRRFRTIGGKPGYKTLLVSDNSRYETMGILTLESEVRTYDVRFESRSLPVEKNMFVLVKADFQRRGSALFYGEDIQILERK